MIGFTLRCIWDLLRVGLTRLLLIVLGCVVVPLALCWKKVGKDQKDFSYHSDSEQKWFMVNLPHWAWLFDNLRDGARGDTRGYYWLGEKGGLLQHPKWIRGMDFVKYFYWLNFRNPSNNAARYTRFLACNTRELVSIKTVGPLRIDGKSYATQMVTARTYRGKVYWGSYGLKKVGTLDVYWRIGWKIEDRHLVGYAPGDDDKAWKSFTVRLRIKRNDK